MKFLLDFLPILLFFIVYKFAGIYVATLTAMIGSLLQVSWSRYKTGKFEKMPVITLFTLLIFGGATLFFRNELFIKWKLTAFYWILALAFLISQFFSKKTNIERLLEKSITLPAKVWQCLNLSWILFFVVMGSLNLYVAYSFNTDTWVNFKLFGGVGLTLLFVLVQAFYLTKHIEEKKLVEEKVNV